MTGSSRSMRTEYPKREAVSFADTEDGPLGKGKDSLVR